MLSLKDIQLDMDVDETEPTLEGNAILKATSFYKAAKIPCFSDDTGLEVASINGAPGVKSARYAGEHCSSKDNIVKLLGALEDKTDRSACFRTIVAFCDGKNTYTFEGRIDGHITKDERGSNGFGYDPVFQPDGLQETFAQLDPDFKNSISHRGKAIQAFAQFLLTYKRV